MENLHELLNKAAEAVRRDLNHIFSEVSLSKLSASSSRDLVAYVKLLSDVLDKQQEEIKDLATKSEDELKKMATELLNTSP